MKKEELQIFKKGSCCITLKNKMIYKGDILEIKDESLLLDDRFNGTTLIDISSISSIGFYDKKTY